MGTVCDIQQLNIRAMVLAAARTAISNGGERQPILGELKNQQLSLYQLAIK